MPKKPKSPVIGTWELQEMDLWDEDAFNMCGQAHIRFTLDHLGSLRFIAVQGEIDWRESVEDGKSCVEWTFEGDDDGSQVSGRGHARIEENGLMSGRLFFHLGDESGFVAVREGVRSASRKRVTAREQTDRSAPHLRLVEASGPRTEDVAETVAGKSLAFTNQKGRTYYLHQGTTKTGKPRYFVATTIREGAINQMPEGYEFAESINAVVSVRRVESGETSIAIEDLDVVKKEVGRHSHLAGYRVDVRGNAIIVYEPTGGLGADFFDVTERLFGGARHRAAREALDLKRVRYEPVLRFERDPAVGYFASRMTYRGDGGWMSLGLGRLKALTKKYIVHLGTDRFFELF